jgi:hypothetical protein
MLDSLDSDYTRNATEWEVTKRTIGGKIRQYTLDQIWDETHKLAEVWAPGGVDALEHFKTCALGNFAMEHTDLPHMNRFLAFQPMVTPYIYVYSLIFIPLNFVVVLRR